MANSEVQIQVLRTRTELEEVRHVWESWPGHRDSDMDVYLTVLRSGKGVERPHVVVIYRGGQPDAIFVGRIDHGQMNFRLGYFELKPKADVLYFVYGALRGNPSLENCKLLISEVCQSLARGEADVAYLNFLRTDSYLYELARSAPGFLSRDRVHAVQPHFSLKLTNVDSFYQGLSSKTRSTQKRKAKKLLNDFPEGTAIKCFRQMCDVDALAEIADCIASKSYQRGLDVGFVDNAEMRERLRLEAAKGWLRGYILYLADCPSAFWIGHVKEGIYGSDYLAFDPAFGSHSPGMYLIMRIIEDFCRDTENRVTEVDFSPGHAQYKEVLGNCQWQEGSVYIFSRTVKGVELNFLRSAVSGTHHILKRTLGQTSALHRLKKIWRDHARQAKP